MSLGTKTIALLAAIVLAVLTTASLFSLHHQEQSLRDAILEGIDGQAKVASQAISSFLDESLREAGAASEDLPLDALARGDQGEVEAHLTRMLRIFPRFQNGIFLLDRDGTFLTDHPAHPELRGRSFAFREYFQRTLRENRGVVGTPYRSTRTARPVLTFTAPVRDAGGRIVAVLGCSVDLLSREALGGYRQQKHGQGGYLYIFDQSRLLILHPQDERLLTGVEEGKNRLLEAALRGFQGAGETVNSVGVPMLLALRRVPGADWIVGIQVPQDEAYAPVARARTRFVATSAVAVLLVVLFGAAAIRRVTRPLQQLEAAALQIASGLADTDAVSGPDSAGAHGALESLEAIRSRDEIGRLAVSFRLLAARLQETLASLERSAEESKRLEREALRAEKLASLATMAGEIAHDFNNSLAAILGNVSAARVEIGSNASVAEILTDAEQAALRAKEKTSQLLALSMRQPPRR